jgi:hypothetical protein
LTTTEDDDEHFGGFRQSGEGVEENRLKRCLKGVNHEKKNWKREKKSENYQVFWKESGKEGKEARDDIRRVCHSHRYPYVVFVFSSRFNDS